MGKISPVSIKYIIRAVLKLSGRAEKPDVIGAVFGQTEGLLGADLELRELQKSGRIGRIDVNLKVRDGKAEGEILVPSSVGKSETALIAAALETIEKIGPCDAKIEIETIEDVRVSKRNYVIKRAKELLKKFVETMPDTAELAKDVAETVRAMDIVEYGEDKLPAGKGIQSAEEIIIVEGRADVLHLLKYGIHNVIGLNGSRAPHSIVSLANSKETTVFVDGDRGGDLILKNLISMADLDFAARAPDGKEVEELTLKEINKALRAKVEIAQYIKDNDIHVRKQAPRTAHRTTSRTSSTRTSTRTTSRTGTRTTSRPTSRTSRPTRRTDTRQPYSSRSRVSKLSRSEASNIKKIADELVGTKGAYLLDKDLEILGKVPVSELANTLKDVDKVYAVVMDGSTERALVEVAERKRVKHIVAKLVKVKSENVDIVPTPSL